MFANIRKHQKWLWILISAAVIISFVWYFNPNSSSGAGSVFGQDPVVGQMNGRSITRSEFFQARKEAQLNYFFSRGSWPGSDEFSRGSDAAIEGDAKNRLVLKQKIKEHNIHVSMDEVAKWMAEAFGNREKGFSVADYDRIVKEFLQPHGVSEADLNRFARTQVALMHLLNVAGSPGRLVTPQEAEVQYRRENEQASVEAVIFNPTNYTSQVKMDPASLAAFYTNQAAMYRIPERAQITYVAFEATNYFPMAEQKLAGVSNLTQRIEETYQQRGAKFYTETNGAPMAPDAAKQKIREEFRHSFAMLEARKAANEFAEELFNLPGARQLANLENLAAAKGFVAKTSEPFSQFEGPKGLEVPERFGQMVFMLTPGDPLVEEPVVGADAVYVVGLKQKLKSEIPPIEAVMSLTNDFVRSQSQLMAKTAGIAFHSKLTNAMASGKTFAAAAAELGEKVTTPAPFTQTARTIAGLDPRVDPSLFKNVAFSLKEGETSSFTSTRDGGFVLHVNKFMPVADDVVKNALPDFLAQLQRNGQNEAFNEWFTRQIQMAKVTLITDKQAGPADAQPEPE